jgi:glycosyltransferase involved in cell wall biosynthesis
MKSIGLCMIVKNERHVIARCLDSVRPLIDFVLIEDTGSTDGTEAAIRDWLTARGIPGLVIAEPWRDFAYNRSHALAELRKVATVDYALIIDADDQLVLEEGFRPEEFKAGMLHDVYDVQIRHMSSRFLRPQICSNRLAFGFKAVLHEFLAAPEGASRGRAEGFHIATGRGGARNQNPRKYQDDAAALERALTTESDPFLISRYTFYLAQSYRDCGEKEKALANYLRRAEQGFWHEEIYFSLYQAARLKEALGHPAEETIALYLKAGDFSPERAEALHGAARYCRLIGRNEEGFAYAKRAVGKQAPDGALFSEEWIYQYGALDELAVNGFWAGHHREALAAGVQLLASPTLPADQRERVARNAQFSLEKLPRDPNPALFRPAGLVPGRHAPQPRRGLHMALPDPAPRLLVAILAKQKERTLPLYLRCIEALDYPKNRITLYIRTNNNTDRTLAILAEWVERVRGSYAAVEVDAADVPERVQDFGVHEWNATRFGVLGAIRRDSLQKTLAHGCDFYFTADVDNFLRPFALRELVALNLPIVSPLLRSSEERALYSNYHADIDANGYYRECDQYGMILWQSVVGVLELPVVHCTYLIRAGCIPELAYQDGTRRHEYVVFSESARRAGIPQYLDNRQVYGYLTLSEEPEVAERLLAAEIGPPAASVHVARKPGPELFACFGLHGSGSTWMFNLVRAIARSAGVDFVSLHRDSEANLPREALGRKLIIVKTPNPFPGFQAFIAAGNAPAVITVRDPRDALVSFMQRFPTSLATSFEEALAAMTTSARSLVAMMRQRQLPVFRYEDGFVGKTATFDAIASLLGVTVAADERSAILAGLTPESVSARIRDLEAAGSIRGEEVWDHETHWHAGHVGDGRVGKHADILSEGEEQRIRAEMREFCDCFGYDLGAPAAAAGDAGSPAEAGG